MLPQSPAIVTHSASPLRLIKGGRNWRCSGMRADARRIGVRSSCLLREHFLSCGNAGPIGFRTEGKDGGASVCGQKQRLWIAATMGARVMLFPTSAGKTADAKRMGAAEVVVSKDAD